MKWIKMSKTLPKEDEIIMLAFNEVRRGVGKPIQIGSALGFCRFMEAVDLFVYVHVKYKARKDMFLIEDLLWILYLWR